MSELSDLNKIVSGNYKKPITDNKPDSVMLIVAGSRDFNNYELLKAKLDYFLSSNKKEVIIISGTARGADSLGELYAKFNMYGIIRIPANWSEYGKRAGYLRNKEMAEIATHCVVFWDGVSKGTKHMIDLAKQYKLVLRVVMFKQVSQEI